MKKKNPIEDLLDGDNIAEADPDTVPVKQVPVMSKSKVNKNKDLDGIEEAVEDIKDEKKLKVLRKLKQKAKDRLKEKIKEVKKSELIAKKVLKNKILEIIDNGNL